MGGPCCRPVLARSAQGACGGTGGRQRVAPLVAGGTGRGERASCIRVVGPRGAVGADAQPLSSPVLALLARQACIRGLRV